MSHPDLPDDLPAIESAFEQHTGARLLFSAAELPKGPWYEIIVPLDATQRVHAGQIALVEARKYPQGYLARAGLQQVALFAGLATAANDGYHTWDEDLGGYVYYGMWSGQTLVAAAYTDRQLPLTLHHEMFHAIDGASGLTADDARFQAAVSGVRPYPALNIPSADLDALRAKAGGLVLAGAVGEYSGKSAGEDEAETARQLMMHLPGALVQMHDKPTLAGSQRMLHVLAEYAAAPGGPGVSHWVDVALGRDRPVSVSSSQAWRDVLRPDGAFVVHGSEDANGVNWTLRTEVVAFGGVSASEVAAGRSSELAVRQLAFLADYYAYVSDNWKVSRGTRDAFEGAQRAIVLALPAGPLANALSAASLRQLSASLDPDAKTAPALVVGKLAEAGVAVNPTIAKVDAALSDRAAVAAVRRVQPAAVRLTVGSSAASGVNLSSSGRILTAAHVPDRVGRKVDVEFPDGSRYRATCTAIDDDFDLAILEIDGARDLPWAPLAKAAPAVGTNVVIVGQPGRFTPDGEPTHYQPFHVSAGEVRKIAANRLADQSRGGVGHDAWTYWGHSGSPLFDENGRVIAIHNSWDPETAMRHAVTWEAIQRFITE